MKTGFIGTGSMGSILIESFIRSGALKPEDIIVNNRTRAKAERLAAAHPGLTLAESNAEAAERCDLLFLCVKPLEMGAVIENIKSVVRPEQIVVSIASPVMLEQLESLIASKVAKVIPSITNSELCGATLCVYGSRMSESDMAELERLLGFIGTPFRVAESHIRVASDISSIGPAILAFLIRKLIDAAVEETGISHEEADRLAALMTHGTGKLLAFGGFTTETLQKRVSVPGGITAAALQMLSEELDGTFNRLIRLTHLKFREDAMKVAHSLSVRSHE